MGPKNWWHAHSRVSGLGRELSDPVARDLHSGMGKGVFFGERLDLQLQILSASLPLQESREVGNVLHVPQHGPTEAVVGAHPPPAVACVTPQLRTSFFVARDCEERPSGFL